MSQDREQEVRRILDKFTHALRIEHYDFHYDAKLEAIDELIQLFKQPALLTDEDFHQLEKDNPLLDFCMIDDYRQEINVMLEAQRDKAL